MLYVHLILFEMSGDLYLITDLFKKMHIYVKLTGWEKEEAPNKAYFDSQYAIKFFYASLSIDSRWQSGFLS